MWGQWSGASPRLGAWRPLVRGRPPGRFSDYPFDGARYGARLDHRPFRTRFPRVGADPELRRGAEVGDVAGDGGDGRRGDHRVDSQVEGNRSNVHHLVGQGREWERVPASMDDLGHRRLSGSSVDRTEAVSRLSVLAQCGVDSALNSSDAGG